MKTRLGTYEGENIYYDSTSSKLSNRHILAIGASGGGKTVAIERIICDVVKQGGTVLTFDFHNSLTDDQIFGPFVSTFNEFRNDIYANNGGIPLRLFEPVRYHDNSEENIDDSVDAVADILYRGLKIPMKERAILRSAINSVVEFGSYERNGFKAIGDALKEAGGKESDLLYERLYPLFKKNIFVDGDGTIQKGKINIIHLSRLDLSSQEIIVELMLCYIWRCANAGIYKDKDCYEDGIYVFIDEVQNVNSEANAPVSLLISEGRRLGVRLLLATQMVLKGTTSALQQRLTQAGMIMYFKPTANRISLTANDISPGNSTKWKFALATLRRGQFIATGEFVLENGTSIAYPVLIDGYIGQEEEYANETPEGGDLCVNGVSNTPRIKVNYRGKE